MLYFYFYSILVLCAATLLALRSKISRKSPRFFLPLLAISSFVLYEITLPESVTMRVDLLIIWPVLGPTIGLALYRFRYSQTP